ncbi:hypothetical protein CAPTEDRAFT_165151 [Capitella teleta]|uniref:RING-type E3 ubiquitin transferase n=1 Tax=Capitella teleta TaxID=283909 RepID=R7U7P6_CAPTE|nr:hypothetical protein CAPTEDRAFT_165151 [Capitella teleta]|eukprot:ELU01969.1 hypothetical protein CAPTEDRAFT_165151 [Capitella teleta]
MMEDAANSGHVDTDQSNPALQSLEVILNSLGMPPPAPHSPQRQSSSDESSSSSRDSQEREGGVGVPRPLAHRHVFLAGDQRHQHFQSLLESLLSGVARGTFGRTGRGTFNMSLFPSMELHGNPADYAWGSSGLDDIVSRLLNQLEGSGPPPADKGQIESLPSIQVSQKDIDVNLQCSVCFEDFKLDESVKQLPCQHIYHSPCIVPWLQRHGTCPVCRKNLDGEVPAEPATFEPSEEGGASNQADTDQDMYFSFEDEYD